MTVSNGELANQDTFNNAFASLLADNHILGSQALEGALRSTVFADNSGPTINGLNSIGMLSLRLTHSGAVTLNGISGGADGKIVLVHNDTGADVTVNHNSGSAGASDKIYLVRNSSKAIPANGMALFQYDSLYSVWHLLFSGALPSGGTANQLVGKNSTASDEEWKTLNGTTDQIDVTHSAGAIALAFAANARRSLGAQQKFSGIEDKSLVTLSYRADTRLLTVTYAPGAAVWNNGQRFVKAGSETLSHNTTTGKQFYYYDASGVLTVGTTPYDLLTQAPIALVYYKHNATPANAKGILFDERHPAGSNDAIADADHRWKHLFIGTQLSNFPVISAYTLNNAGNVPYAISSCVVEDEDLKSTLTAMPDNGPYPMLWVDNAAGTWDWDFTTSTNGLLMSGGNMQWNNPATGALTALNTNGHFMNMWPIALPILGYSLGSAFTAYTGFMVIIGQAEYTSLALAQAVTPSNLLFVTNFTEEGVIFSRVSYTRVTGSPQIPADPTYFKGNLTNLTVSSFVPTDHNLLSGRSALGAHPASAIAVDVTNLGGNIPASNDTVQKCIDAVDDLVLASGGSFTTQNFTGTTISLTAAGFQRWRYTGSSPQTFTAFTLTLGVDACELEIFGTSDTNTITIPMTATGILRQNGDVELGAGQSIKYGYDTTLAGLYEKSRSN